MVQVVLLHLSYLNISLANNNKVKAFGWQLRESVAREPGGLGGAEPLQLFGWGGS